MPHFILVMSMLLLSNSQSAPSTRTVEFAGLTWDVRDGDNGKGPGNRCWSDDEESVWIDDQGRLHLRARRLDDGRWCQAQVRARATARYGDHLFQVVTPPGPLLHELDPNLVVGLFLYRDDDREIDIEITRSFGDSELNAWHVVQESDTDGSERHGFSMITSGSHTSHVISWRRDRVKFISYHGHCDGPPCGGIVAQWRYKGRHNPSQRAGLRPYLQIWINNDAELEVEQEIIVADYRGPVRKED